MLDIYERQREGGFHQYRKQLKDFDNLLQRHKGGNALKYELMYIQSKLRVSLRELLSAIYQVGIDPEKVEEKLQDRMAVTREELAFNRRVQPENLTTPVNLKILRAFHKLWDECEIRCKDYMIMLYDYLPKIYVSHGYPGMTDSHKGWSLSLNYTTSKMEYFIRDFNLKKIEDIHNITVEHMYDLYLRGRARLWCGVGHNLSALIFTLTGSEMYATIQGPDKTFKLDKPLEHPHEYVDYTREFYKEDLAREKELYPD